MINPLQDRLALVIGAGVVGLASARALALRGCEVIVAEQADTIGTGVSSRNSEVIHAGMYYPTGSLRARHCVAGRRLLYEFCATHGIPHRKCGKLIVAVDERERAKIESIHKQGQINDVEGLHILEGHEARTLEPQLSCLAALLSAETGIVDSHALMLAMQGEIEDHGGMIAFKTPILRITRAKTDGALWDVEFGGSDPGMFSVDIIVNSAGLGAQSVAGLIDGFPLEHIPRQVLAKGNYFAYQGRPAFTHLIYPAPVDGGLGTHVTLDLSGRMKFGPDVEWIDQEHYEVDPRRGDTFYAAVRRYWPGLPDGSIVPDYAGIRPKLSGPGEAPVDFRLDGPADHGQPGLVNLFGIESPGLTASLSIAEAVCEMIQRA